jgi:mono/diheme cytochrome c family protein/plastocyanin
MTDPDRPADPGEPPAIPGSGEGGRELIRREATPPSVARFTAPDTAHTVGLTEERAAQIVRQSANARSVGLWAILFVLVFVPIYWFWENGFPLLPGTSRLQAESTTQYVTDVARGEALFLANCARCHGATGKGESGPYGYVDSHGTAVIGFASGGAPPLNDQDKLFKALTTTGAAGTGHLNPNYLHAVLREGGRYVCGDARSIMPVWDAANGGPLDYRAIQEIIAFITASSDTTWTTTVVDPLTGARTQEVQHGWRDPAYDPGVDATPFPACWRATPAPTATTPAGPTPTIVPGTAANPRVIAITGTASLTWDPNSIVLVAGEVVRFEITNSAGFPHNFYIGAPADVEAHNFAALQGTSDFSSGMQALSFTVPASGQLEYACLIPGHLEAGMRGTVTLLTP